MNINIFNRPSISAKNLQVYDGYNKGNRMEENNILANRKSDSISISNKEVPSVGLQIDKGTAAHTTMTVDRGTFNQIMNYSANNKEAQWSELGIDDEKRWIVINGQRFESPLSKEEKELREKMRRNPLLDAIAESDEKRAEMLERKKDAMKFKINFSGDKPNVENIGENDKIKNLLSNEKVMNMLKDIAKSMGGSLIMSA